MIKFGLSACAHNMLMRDWAKHSKYWRDCTKCPLGKRAKFHVLGRGSLPCDILIIGEAPGPDENKQGEPFIGPAGEVLQRALKEVWKRLLGRRKVYITNTVACIPVNRKGGQFRKPKWEEVWECSTRIRSLMTMATPKMVMLLGNVADEAWKSYYGHKLFGKIIPSFHVYHPGYIMRNGGAKGKLFQRWVTEIVNHILALEKAAIRKVKAR